MSEGNGNGEVHANVIDMKRLSDAAETTSRRLAVDEADIRYLLDKVEALRTGTTPWQRRTDARIDAAIDSLDAMAKAVTSLAKRIDVLDTNNSTLIHTMKDVLVEFRSTKAPVCTCGLQGLGGK